MELFSEKIVFNFFRPMCLLTSFSSDIFRNVRKIWIHFQNDARIVPFTDKYLPSSVKKTETQWNAIYFCVVQNIGLGPVYLIKRCDDGNDDNNNNCNGALIYASESLFNALHSTLMNECSSSDCLDRAFDAF